MPNPKEDDWRWVPRDLWSPMTPDDRPKGATAVRWSRCDSIVAAWAREDQVRLGLAWFAAFSQRGKLLSIISRLSIDLVSRLAVLERKCKRISASNEFAPTLAQTSFRLISMKMNGANGCIKRESHSRKCWCVRRGQRTLRSRVALELRVNVSFREGCNEISRPTLLVRM